MHLWASKHGQIEVQPSLYEQHLMEQGKEIERLARIFLEEHYLKGTGVELGFERTFVDGNFRSISSKIPLKIASRYSVKIVELKL